MKKGLFIFYLFGFLFVFGQTEPVSLPYSNSFETEDDRNYWYNINTGPGNPWVITDESNNLYGPSDGEYYARFQSSFQNGGNAWLITKGINFQAGENIVLEFDYRSSLSSNYPQKMEILLKSVPAPGTENSTQLWVHEAIQTNVYQSVYQTFQVPESGTYHLVFHVYSDPNFGYLSTDNLNLYVEQCPKPTNIQVMPGQTTAEISWETGSQPGEGFEYVVQPAGSGIPTGSGNFVIAPLTTATDLQPETAYEVYVRSVCEPGTVYSNWSNPKTFTTYPAPTAMAVNLPYHESFEQESHWLILQPEQGQKWERVNDNIGTLYGPSDGEYYMRHFDSANPSDAWVFSRGINLSAGEEITLQFDYKSSQDAHFPQKMKVVIGKDAFPSNNAELLWNNDFIQSTTYQTVTLTFTVPENGVYYLGYHAYSEPNSGYLMFDNVKVYKEGISPCEYVLRLKDSFGDGWNNNTMSLFVNGDVVFDNITLPVGDMMDFPFQVSSNDAITAVWHGGSHSGWETSYEIYDSEGNLVGSASEENIDIPIYTSCPDCAKPSGVTAHYGQTTVDLEWVFLTEPADGYEYAVQLAGTGQPSVGTHVNATQVHIDGLTPETDYEIYVRSVCEEELQYSSWAGPVRFKTLPLPGEPVDLPYYYGFETEDGWISQSISRNNEWSVTNIFNPSEGQYHAVQNYNFYFDANSWFFSRGLNLQSGQEIVIKFMYKASGFQVPLSLNIGKEAYAFEQNIELWSGLVSNLEYQQGVVLFTPETSGVYYLGFHSLAAKGQTVFIDDIQVYTVGLPDAPDCEYNCPEDIVVESNSGDMGAVVNYSLDFDCEDSSTGVISVLVQGLPSGAIFPIGETTVTHNLIFNGEIIATCSFTVTVEEGNLGVDDVNNGTFSYYPNPVKDRLNINMDKNIENVSIYSLSGEMVKSENWNKKAGNIDMSVLPSGIYIVNVKTSSNVRSFKVVKN